MHNFKAVVTWAAVSLLILGSGIAHAAPEIQHWTTDNGARVYFIAARELPIVDVQVVFDAGSARDAGAPGLATLTNKLIQSGTAEIDADAVADRLDGVGAQLDAGAERDMAWLSLRTLSDPQYRDKAVEIVSEILSSPAFAAESFERERGRLIAAARESTQSPNDVAERAFYEALYGDHPYASPPEGTVAGLEGATRGDVEAFYKRYYVASNAVVAIVGDLDRAHAEQLANAVVGSLPAGEPAPQLPPIPPDSDQERVVSVPFPSSQSHVYVGQVGIKRGDPDYFSLYLGNQVLGGGGLVSMLSTEVREARGLSYSVYSYFLPMREAGPFLVGLQTRTDQVTEALQVAEDTLSKFVGDGPDPQQLEAARQNIVGGFPLRIDNNSKMTKYLAVIGFYGLPLDYLQKFPATIEALTRDDVADAFKRRVHPDRLTTVIVGNGSS